MRIVCSRGFSSLFLSDVIRSKIKTFAQQTASASVVRKSDGKAIPPFKLIILDEADSMTNSAQVSAMDKSEVDS